MITSYQTKANYTFYNNIMQLKMTIILLLFTAIIIIYSSCLYGLLFCTDHEVENHEHGSN